MVLWSVLVALGLGQCWCGCCCDGSGGGDDDKIGRDGCGGDGCGSWDDNGGGSDGGGDGGRGSDGGGDGGGSGGGGHSYWTTYEINCYRDFSPCLHSRSDFFITSNVYEVTSSNTVFFKADRLCEARFVCWLVA